MSIVLKNQVEATERSVAELEREIHHDHHRAMLCRDVEDLMGGIVNLLADLNRHVERWQDESAASSDEGCHDGAGFAAEFDGLYRSLDGVCFKTAGLIRILEAWGFVMKAKEDFMAAWKQLQGIVCFSLDRVQAAKDQIDRGQGRELGEFLNELRGHSLG